MCRENEKDTEREQRESTIYGNVIYWLQLWPFGWCHVAFVQKLNSKCWYMVGYVQLVQ